jgi:hypothetical protein
MSDWFDFLSDNPKNAPRTIENWETLKSTAWNEAIEEMAPVTLHLTFEDGFVTCCEVEAEFEVCSDDVWAIIDDYGYIKSDYFEIV